MKSAITSMILGTFLLTGCNEQPKPTTKAAVNVDAQRGKGVEVNAPGVNVKVNKDGTDVKAPGVDVDIKR